MLKLFIGNSPDHSKKPHINIISTLSSTDKILSVLNNNKAAIFDRTYRMNESRI